MMELKETLCTFMTSCKSNVHFTGNSKPSSASANSLQGMSQPGAMGLDLHFPRLEKPVADRNTTSSSKNNRLNLSC